MCLQILFCSVSLVLWNQLENHINTYRNHVHTLYCFMDVSVRPLKGHGQNCSATDKERYPGQIICTPHQGLWHCSGSDIQMNTRDYQRLTICSMMDEAVGHWGCETLLASCFKTYNPVTLLRLLSVHPVLHQWCLEGLIY